jgi:hypothetical protein
MEACLKFLLYFLILYGMITFSVFCYGALQKLCLFTNQYWQRENVISYPINCRRLLKMISAIPSHAQDRTSQHVLCCTYITVVDR